MQSLRIRDSSSSFKEVLAGVPQGSNLSPIFFAIFINDITTHITTVYLIYADDIKIFTCINDLANAVTLQVDL